MQENRRLLQKIYCNCSEGVCDRVCMCPVCVQQKAGLLSCGLQLLYELSVKHALCVDVKSLQQPITAAFSSRQLHNTAHHKPSV